MSDLLARKFRFFRDCFANEHQSKALWNIFSSQNQHIRYITADRIQNGQITFRGQYADQLSKSVNSYKREKQLMLGHTFIVAKRKVSSFGREESREQNICFPVIYFPAEIQFEHVESVSVKIDFQHGEINPALIHFFRKYDFDIAKVLKPKLDAAKTKVGKVDVAKVETGEEGFDKSLARELSLYIEGIAKKMSIDITIDRDEKNPKSLLNIVETGKAYFQNASILSLIPKQESLQEILYELEVLANRPSSSMPLNKILFEKSQESVSLDQAKDTAIGKFFNRDSVEVGIPATLSDAQMQAIDNAGKYPLSLLIGPPGTG